MHRRIPLACLAGLALLPFATRAAAAPDELSAVHAGAMRELAKAWS